MLKTRLRKSVAKSNAQNAIDFKLSWTFYSHYLTHYECQSFFDFSIYLRGKNEALSTVFIWAENFESAFQMMDFAFFEWLK